MNQLARREGATEALIANDQMEWVRRMNNIRAGAEKLVLRELVYLRADRHAAKAFEYPHGGEGREDDQRGDQQRADEVHGQYYQDRDDNGNKEIMISSPFHTCYF